MLVVRSTLRLLSVGAALGGFACSGPNPAVDEPPAAYVGRAACARCHERETELFTRSHHDLAMAEASEETVLGDFSGAHFTYGGVTSTFFEREGRFHVRTDGPDGELRDYEIAYTFGVEPLQQYLVAFPSGPSGPSGPPGRYQALSIAWDTKAEKWFHLYPGEGVDFRDPLHWTRRLQNWNLMCAECHSTGLEKHYDLENDRYETTWAEIDVSCEACHGPGSRHVAWAEIDESERPSEDGLAVDLSDGDDGVWVTDMETGLSRRNPRRSSRLEIETCGRCHARRSARQAEYVHGRPLLDTHRVALLTEPLYFADGQIDDEVYVYGSFLQSKMYREGVTCKDCHDPHRLSVRGEGNSVCAACHLPEKFDVRDHHRHEPGAAGARCVSCHMPERTYMVVDPRRDHSFRVPRPDLAVRLGTPDACSGCHREKGPTWAADALQDWFGQKDREPHYGIAFDATRRGLPGAGSALAGVARNLEAPAIVRATALSMMAGFPTDETPGLLQGAVSDADPLVRLGALESAEVLSEGSRHAMIVPLLRDPVRSVRLEAVRALASVPDELFTPEQRAELEQGLEEYRAAQLENADWPESHLNVGVVALARGDLSGAERAYETALKIDPGFAAARVNLADLYREQSRDVEGEALLRRGLDHRRDEPELRHALGFALVRLERRGEAVGELARAFELAPESARYGYVYAVALHGVGEKERAVAVLEGVLERHPFDRDVLQALVAFHRELGSTERALFYARKLEENR